MNKSDEKFLEHFFVDCLDEKTFYKESDAYIKTHVEESPCILVIEVNNFRFFYLWYGRAVSRRYFADMIRCLAECKKEFNGVLGFFGGARFALCISGGAGQVETVRRRITECPSFQNNNVAAFFFPVIGVCSAINGDYSAATMYNRARSVIRSLRKNYTEHIAEYKREADEEAAKRTATHNTYTDIRRGLDENEFVFFLQPKCDMRTGKILGAEALVRWKHKERGYISPGEFIPLCEKSGLVSLVDRRVWEDVFAWQRRWIDAGHKPLPISINVSRIDMLSLDVASHMKSLAEKYRLSPNLIEIELTESLYVENGKVILKTVDAIKAAGFPLLMDDFGSGYSSLNVLRSIDFDILKIDMKFLFKPDEHEQRGIKILESIVNMARLLDLPVIIEGVETDEQVKLLLDMGCRYAQGYYYYRPMPAEDYEKLVSNKDNVDYSGYKGKHVDQIHLRELIDHMDVSETRFNDFLGAVVMYDQHDGKITRERVNEPYYRIFRSGSVKVVSNEDNYLPHVRQEEYDKFRSLLDKAYENHPQYACGDFHYRMSGTAYWLYARVFFLREENGHRHFIGFITDISSLEQKEGAQ